GAEQMFCKQKARGMDLILHRATVILSILFFLIMLLLTYLGYGEHIASIRLFRIGLLLFLQGSGFRKHSFQRTIKLRTFIRSDGMNFKLPKNFYFKKDSGKSAALLLHGFTGNTSDVRQLGRFFEKKGMTAYSFNYEGHAEHPKNITKSSPYIWYKQAVDA